MKRCQFAATLTPLLLSLSLTSSRAESPPASPTLQLAPQSNAWELVVGSLSSTGALFLHQAPDLPTLTASPSLLVQTNTPLADALRLPVLPASGLSNQAFFSAVFWPGRSVDEFGDPEYHPDEPPPAMILLTSGAPTNLASGQTFTVDFFITDPTGQLLDITAWVAILVLRESDGAPHPDAQVSPSTGQMTNGHLRLEITLQAATPLDGYTLGLGPASSPAPLFQELDWLRLLGPPPHPLDGFLRTAFNLGPTPLDVPTGEALVQILNQRRLDNADTSWIWSDPMPKFAWRVSGTFGEWRGDNDTRSHGGVDLGTAGTTTVNVKASRNGVVSFCGPVPNNQGECLVVDHGNGWFSRYLHLDPTSISVRVGQAVQQGTTILATRLFTKPNWGEHLHFEVRAMLNQAQWNVMKPGTGWDPLQEHGVFTVPSGQSPPQLLEFGLTRGHPGEKVYAKTVPDADADGEIYVFAKFRDQEGGNRLGLRAMRFRADGMDQADEICPRNDIVVGELIPPGSTKGFAKYTLSGGKPLQDDWFRYWWRWDTSAYAAEGERKGPRHFVLWGEDHSQAPVSDDFWFGPEVANNLITPIAAQQYQFTIRAHLGTNTPAVLGNPALFVQPDQYKLELLQPNGQPLGAVGWSGQMAGNYTKVFAAHLEEAVYTFTLPGGTTPEGLKLRVSSRLAPDIGHEVCFCSGPNMVFIRAGTFVMGSPPDEPARYSDEGPQTVVTISRGFCMGAHEVTQAEYLAVMGSNPSYFQGDMNRPVEQVSWNDAVAYCAALTAQERAAGRLPAGYEYRLPTEAQWEYACRAGTTTPFHYGSALRSGMANFYGQFEYPPCAERNPWCYNPSGIYLGRTTAVRSYAPNAWGLYDMHGNVWEWCQDWYGPYSGGNVSDPPGPATGLYRVFRGGCWGSYAFNCRSALRLWNSPSYYRYYFGFRVALVSVP